MNTLLFNFSEEALKNMMIEAVREGIANHDTKSTNEDGFLTRQEAADLIKVSVTTIDTWRRIGLIQGYRINSRIRFSKAELLEAVKKNSPKRR